MLDRTGRKYGRLTAIELADGRGSDGSHRWLCRCECGNDTIVPGTYLNSGRTAGCGCRRKKAYGEAVKNRPLSEYRYSARKRGHSWDLTDEEFHLLVVQECFYCGCSPSRIVIYKDGSEYACNGLDRIDNTGGYTMSNVVTCCWTCNEAKGSKAYDEFVGWIDCLAAHRDKWRNT
jgi:hypothetical protein